MGIWIKSSNGYVRKMIAVLVPAAKIKGDHPGAVVCSFGVPAGSRSKRHLLGLTRIKGTAAQTDGTP